MEQFIGKNRHLQTTLEVEEMYGLMTMLVASTDLNSALCAVEDAIPCVTNGSNRIGEKKNDASLRSIDPVQKQLLQNRFSTCQE